MMTVMLLLAHISPAVHVHGEILLAPLLLLAALLVWTIPRAVRPRTD